ncbi:MAG: hypothetical protein ACRDVG_06790, partial [Jatrophihabitantaceae bacterium]
ANPAASVLVPGQPTAGVRCAYATPGWLLASWPLDTGSLPRIVHAINALPRGSLVGAAPAFEHDVVRFDYADGSSRTLLVRLGDPTVYTDGAHSGLDHANRVTDQLRTAAR